MAAKTEKKIKSVTTKRKVAVPKIRTKKEIYTFNII